MTNVFNDMTNLNPELLPGVTDDVELFAGFMEVGPTQSTIRGHDFLAAMALLFDCESRSFLYACIP